MNERGHIRFLLDFFRQQEQDRKRHQVTLQRHNEWWRQTRAEISSIPTVEHPRGLE